MTNEELAKSMLMELEGGYISYSNMHRDHGQGLNIIKCALEKQIPAEVFYDEAAEVDTIRCPACDTPVDEYYCEKYCWHCGQRLLWKR